MFNVEFLEQIRLRELDELIKFIPRGSRILEFGAGTGSQARILADNGFDVVAIDLPRSSYSEHRVFPVVDYDGRHIPIENHSVDVIFSSNVLEHVKNLEAISDEFRRVLKPDGFGLHVMPTPAWRFWTFVAGVPTAGAASLQLITHILIPPVGQSRYRAFRKNLKTAAAALLPIGHGTSKEGISELWTFSPRFWRNRFARFGQQVLDDRPVELFYTGHMVLGKRLHFTTRKRLSRLIGSASHMYVVRPTAFNRYVADEPQAGAVATS